jgi:uncharacterized membrane protein
VTFIFGELLKLVLVERLFSLTREKLMRIPAFARLYESYSQAIAWLKGWCDRPDLLPSRATA